jgi:hypothetical protein
MTAKTVIAVARVHVRVTGVGVVTAERTASPCSLVMREIVRHDAFICGFDVRRPVSSQQNGGIERL